MHYEDNSENELQKQFEGVPEPYHYCTELQESSNIEIYQPQFISERVNNAEDYQPNSCELNTQSENVHKEVIDCTKLPKPILSNGHNTCSTTEKPHFENVEKVESSVTPLHTPRSRLERAAENTPVSTKSSRSNSIARERSRAAEDAVEIMLDRAHAEEKGDEIEYSSHILQKHDTCDSDEDDGNISYKIGSDGSSNSNNGSNVWLTNAINDVNTCN